MTVDTNPATTSPDAPPSPIQGMESTSGAVLADAGSPLNGQPTSESDAEEVESALGLTDGDRRFLWVAGGVILLLAAVQWARLSGFGQQEVEITRLPERQFDFKVDINRATWVEWMQLAGIGELTARKIIADREERGPFESIDDVDRVSGIGPKTLAAIRPWLICSDCGTNAQSASPRE
ncbi:MAG: helix-hairpin-helix domain-containing protein [Planctomycetaceae bacterium]|nr:helix-hairpin-helix domain-containing protein [Planctomycetaceae bacterium]